MKHEQPRILDLLEGVRAQGHRPDVVDVEEARIKVVLTRCGSERLAFLGQDILEIMAGQEISWMPGLPGHLPGLIHVRGEIESVLDLGVLMGLQGTGGFILLAQSGAFRTGILVDSVEDVVDLPRSALRPPLATLTGLARDIVSGELEVDGNLIPLIDLERLAAKATV
jgi:purine-binding chemotaxis protein CheW